MAYFMLDILFLLGNPKCSSTLLDEPFAASKFNVGERITPTPNLQEAYERVLQDPAFFETKVRIDRTSQLLVAMSITVTDFAKSFMMRQS